MFNKSVLSHFYLYCAVRILHSCISSISFFVMLFVFDSIIFNYLAGTSSKTLFFRDVHIIRCSFQDSFMIRRCMAQSQFTPFFRLLSLLHPTLVCLHWCLQCTVILTPGKKSLGCPPSHQTYQSLWKHFILSEQLLPLGTRSLFYSTF